jgi:hypothetical protein
VRTLIVLLAVVLLAGALLWSFGVVDPGFLRRFRGGASEGPPDLVTEGGEDAVGLRGRGREADAAAAGPAADAAADGPGAEALGGAVEGAQVVGRVVRSEGRVPVAGARVELSRPDLLFHYLRADPRGRFDELEAVTGKDGRFAFRRVIPNKGYAVRVRVEGEAVLSRTDLDLRGRPTRDLGDLVVGPSAVLLGRVVGHEGQPVEGARVGATWWVPNPLQVVLADPATLKEVEREVRSDAEGRFRLEALEPGTKTLVLAAPGRGGAVLWRVAVVAGEEFDVGDVPLAGHLPLEGRVEWEGGAPVSDARVYAGRMGAPAVAPADVDAQGRFRIEALPEGPHMLAVLVPGLPIHLVDDVAAGRSDVVVTLPRTGEVRGRVEREASGAPIASFGIAVAPVGEEGWREGMIRRVIDAALGPRPFESGAGAFRIERLPPGVYTLHVTAEGHPPATSEPVTVVSGETAEVVIRVAAGHGLTGTALGPDRDPVAGASVFLAPLTDDERPQESLSWVEEWTSDREPEAVSDGEGRFELPPSTPGVYDLVVAHPERLPRVVRDLDLGAAGGPPLEVVLRLAGGVSGVVTEAGGSPAAEVTVAIAYPSGAVFEIETNDLGRFERRPLPLGRCRVFYWPLPATGLVLALQQAENEAARESAYEALRDLGSEVTVDEGIPREVLLRIPRRTRVQVRMLKGGQPVTEGGVWIVSSSGWRGAWEDVGPDGRLEVLLAPGTYTFWAPQGAGEEIVWTPTEVQVPDAPETTVEVAR